MKTILNSILFLTVVVLFSSCSDKNEIQENENSTVTFSLNGFNIDVTDIPSPRASAQLSEVVKELHYVVYKSSGEFVKYVLYEGEDLKKNITDVLPKGDYIFCFIGSNLGWGYGEEHQNQYLNTSFDNASFMSDFTGLVYFNKSNLSIIGLGKDNISQSITLNRLTGRVDLTIKDSKEIPSNVNSIAMTFRDGYIAKGFKLSSLELIKTKISSTGGNGFERDKFLNLDTEPAIAHFYPIKSGESINGQKSADFYIVGLNENSESVFERKIENFVVQQNQITNLSGSIGSVIAPDNLNLGITTSEDWDKIINIEY